MAQELKTRIYTKYDEEQNAVVMEVLYVDFETRLLKKVIKVTTTLENYKSKKQEYVAECEITFDNYRKWLLNEKYTYIGD